MNETPNGAFPNYVEEQTETRQQYIDRIFGQWLEWNGQEKKIEEAQLLLGGI